MNLDYAIPLSVLFSALLASQPIAAQDILSKPVRLEANGKPIDVTVGHAAPFVRDVDGDGVRDLLVGEFGKGNFEGARLPAATLKKWGRSFAKGKLRIYRNVGTNAAPKFEGFEYLRAGGKVASIPTT